MPTPHHTAALSDEPDPDPDARLGNITLECAVGECAARFDHFLPAERHFAHEHPDQNGHYTVIHD